MRKVIVAIILAMLLFTFAAPVLADDPPDTQVEVGIITSGDVDLNVSVTAGGGVDVIIDGTAYPEAINSAVWSAIANGGRPPIDQLDWYRLWNKEIEPYYNVLSSHDALLNLLTESQAKLIQGQELTRSDIDSIIASLNALRVQDAKTWNQLMYGAERHLTILDSQLVGQIQRVDRLQTEVNLLEAKLEIANTNHTNLLRDLDTQWGQFLVYSLIMGGSVMVLAIGLLLLHLRSKKA